MDTPSDPSLDAILRSVSVPPELADRVKSALVPSDEQVDGWLRRVNVPAELLAGLKEIPADVALDEALADVPHSFALARSLRKATAAGRLRRGARSLVRLAVAASWFLAIYASLVGCVALVIGTVFPLPIADEFELVAIYDGPLSVEGELVSPIAIRPSGDEQSQLAVNAATGPVTVPVSLSDIDFPARPGPVAEWNSLVAAGLRPMDDVVLLRFGVLGSPDFTDDHLPELTSPIPLASSGLVPPMVRAFNRPFFVKHGIYPPAAPAVSELARLNVPLVVQSDLVSRLERAAQEGRKLNPSEVAVHEFIAAIDYRYTPALPDRLAIRTAAGPAIFAPQGAGLLQVGVQAGSFAGREQPSTHLVLAIDLSHSMGRAGRLEIVRHGIGRLLDQLEPADRLSLVVFDEQVIHRVELASREDAPAIRALLRELAPRGGTNLAAGLQQAASLAMLDAAGPSSAQRLVLITDSTAAMPAATLDQVRQMLVVARDAGVRLDVLDVSDRTQIDSTLAEMAANMGGQARAVASQRQMAWSLLEALAGQSPVVAAEARLAIQFNPRTVKAYRLVGHETSALAALKPPTVAADLAVGESATTLIEIWFQPGDADDVGFAELTWRDSEYREQRLRQRISRLQFAPTFDQAPLPLQMGTIAAEIGHELRRTREALREVGLPPVTARGLADVFAAARTTHPQLREREDFQRLLRATESLAK